MRLSPVVKLAALGGVAVGTVATAALISAGSHQAAPTQIVVRQDAQTGSLSAPAVVTSSAPVKRAEPKVAAPVSTVVRQQPAVPQEDPVTDPTPSDPGGGTPAPSPASSAPVFEPIRSHPGNGAPSSTSAISITTSPSGE